MSSVEKWCDSEDLGKKILLSSRVRLARNLENYPFSTLLNKDQARDMISEIVNVFEECMSSGKLNYMSADNISDIDELANFEKNNISQYFLLNKNPKGFFINESESLSVMLNEEDHIRIQSICAGDDINNAFILSDNIDNVISSKIDYAFDDDFGFLTSCPTNVGTGLRASFMLHLPMLEKSGQLKNLVQIISKFGMTVRGWHGEGTEPMGSLYQVSNQITLGKSERDIIKNLRNVTQQIIDQELRLRENILKDDNNKIDFEDKIYRSFGILSNCKKIGTREAMNLLSDVMLGNCMGFDVNKFKINIYKMMMYIQPGLLQKNLGCKLKEQERDIERANFIKSML